MIDHPILTRVGIFEYRRPDGSIRRELRLPEEVFAQESLASYKGKPVILTHEAGMIDSDNVQQEQIGTILSEGTQDGDNVRAQIIIHDARKLDYGLRELSLGYSLDLEEVPGEWQGQPYDAIQRNIRVNHLALVEKARAGDSARLNIDGEDTQEEKGGNTMSKRKDGLTPEEIAQLVEEYKKRKEQRMLNNQPASDSEGEENTQENQDEGEETAADPVQEVKENRDRRDAAGDCETMDEANGMMPSRMPTSRSCWTSSRSCRQRSTSTKRPEKRKPTLTRRVLRNRKLLQRRKRKRNRSTWTASMPTSARRSS